MSQLQKKYIARSWPDIIGQDEVVSLLEKYKTITDLPDFMFVGPSGCGKTACAYVLAYTLNAPLIELNASDERGIETIREKVKTLLFTAGEGRIILLDEADNLTKDAQDSLRRPMELGSQQTNNRLILTVNNPHRIIAPIASRCSILKFHSLSEFHIQKLTLKVLKGEKVFNFSSQSELESKKEEIKQLLLLISSHSHGDARIAFDIIGRYITLEKPPLSTFLREVESANLSEKAFNEALQGDWENCLLTLETYLAGQKTLDNSNIIESFYTCIRNLKQDNLNKILLIKALADCERALHTYPHTNPLIQYSGFLAEVMRILHS